MCYPLSVQQPNGHLFVTTTPHPKTQAGTGPVSIVAPTPTTGIPFKRIYSPSTYCGDPRLKSGEGGNHKLESFISGCSDRVHRGTYIHTCQGNRSPLYSAFEPTFGLPSHPIPVLPLTIKLSNISCVFSFYRATLTSDRSRAPLEHRRTNTGPRSSIGNRG